MCCDDEEEDEEEGGIGEEEDDDDDEEEEDAADGDLRLAVGAAAVPLPPFFSFPRFSAPTHGAFAPFASFISFTSFAAFATPALPFVSSADDFLARCFGAVGGVAAAAVCVALRNASSSSIFAICAIQRRSSREPMLFELWYELYDHCG